MTTELDRVHHDSELTLLPPAQHPAQAAIDMLRGHAEMMDMAYSLATKMCRTQLVPTRFHGKGEDATAAILYGAELGLNPIQALQRVIPIHGQPTLEARTMVALLKARGYKIKTTAQSDQSVTVRGVDLDGEEYQSTWTIERATRAGYTRNQKYQTDPQAMLKAKAQAEVCRDMAPEVLLGIAYSTEDLESERLDSPGGDRGANDAITVEEVISGAGGNAGATGWQGKVKSAAPAADVVDDPDGGASEKRPEPDTSQVSDAGTVDASAPEPAPAAADIAEAAGLRDDPRRAPEPPANPEPTPGAAAPGAPTADTPGQTERVEKALAGARNKPSKARDALLDLITARLQEAGIDTLDDLPAIASSILKTRIQYAATLSDSQLKTVHNALNAWKQADVLAERIVGILEAADMNAEAAQQQDGEQPTLDGAN